MLVLRRDGDSVLRGEQEEEVGTLIATSTACVLLAIPTTTDPCFTASAAYSTWNIRPCGELGSYLLASQRQLTNGEAERCLQGDGVVVVVISEHLDGPVPASISGRSVCLVVWAVRSAAALAMEAEDGGSRACSRLPACTWIEAASHTHLSGKELQLSGAAQQLAALVRIRSSRAAASRPTLPAGLEKHQG